MTLVQFKDSNTGKTLTMDKELLEEWMSAAVRKKSLTKIIMTWIKRILLRLWKIKDRG